MNKKHLTGFMLLLVAGIWGYVGYRFFGGNPAGEETFFTEENSPEQAIPLQIEKNEKLLLNYADPFLKDEVRQPVMVQQTNTVQPKATIKKQEKPEMPVYIWPSIVYKGLIQNKTQPGKLVGVIVVNGQERLVCKGEKVNELVVAGIEKNKVEMVYGKERKIFIK